MESEERPDIAGSLESPTVVPSGINPADPVQATGAIQDASAPVQPEPDYSFKDPRNQRRARLRLIIILVCALLALGGGAFAYLQRSSHMSQVQSGDFATIELPLDKLKQNDELSSSAESLQVNGRLQVSNSLILAPTTQPSKPISGQLYYDKTTKQLGYYDGIGFVFLQGGAASSVINNYTLGNNIYTTNITNVTGGGVSAVNGTPGSIAMFTAADTIGDSTISQSGTTLTVGLGSGAGRTYLQGGTNGIQLLTGNQSGSSGSILLQSGDSATTSSGDITIDTGSGVIDGSQVALFGFETGVDYTFPFIGTLTRSQDCTVSRNGSCSLNITGSDPLSGGNLVYVEQSSTPGFPVIAGHKYYFTMYSKAATTSATISGEVWGFGPNGSCVPNNVVDNSTTWTQSAWTCVAPAGATVAGFIFGFSADTDQTHYFDDITVIDMSSSTSSSSIKIGATNAQDITIGNANEIGLTSIQGGSGIALNSSLGSLSLSGGSFGIAGSAASTLTTARGSLNISAGASSTWQIADSSSTGGNLTIQSGNAGGNGDGGTLVLQGGAGNGSGVGGSISITSGASTSTASGDVNIDTGSGIISGQLVGSKTFESGTDNMADWFNTTVVASTDQARTGTQSLKVTESSNFWGFGDDQNQPPTPVTPGHQYYVSAWIRAATTPRSLTMTVIWVGPYTNTNLTYITDTTTGWTENSGVLTAPAGATGIYLRISSNLGGVGEVHYWDDITITDLSSATAASSINIGTTNAKFITIGNLSQIGTTLIQGSSGITLNAGVSNLNMSAGVFNLTGAAASTITTSAGALTITAAATSSWGISPATSGNGGDLTLYAGDSASGSNGGNLYLQGGLGTGAGVGGSVIVKPREDSSTAFQVQNAAGTYTLLSADTTGHILTVSGDTTTFASLTLSNAHFASTQTNAPTIGTPINCGTSPASAVTVGSTDSAGSFTMTTGTGGTSSTCDTVFTFNQPYGAAPKSIIVVGKTDAASALRQIFVSAATSTTFTVSFGTSAGGANSTTYSFSYWIVE